jgi:uncharacterized phage protein (TIGR02218 family)
VKTLTSGLLAEYASEVMRIATAIKITRRDGEVFGFIEHDQARTYGGLVYVAVTGITVSQLVTSAGLNVDNLEINGFLDAAGIDGIEHESGVWDQAAFEIFDFKWSDVSLGRNLLLTGEIGEVKRSDHQFVAELRSLAAKLQTNFGEVVTPTCPYRFGDAECGFDLASVTLEDIPVSSVTSRRVFVSSTLGTFSPPIDAGYFDRGTVEFTTGANTGFRQDIKAYAADGTITLQLAFPYTIEVTDEFTITPGCNKLLKTADGVYGGDCLVKWDNVVNFGGEPEVPLQNKLMHLK